VLDAFSSFLNSFGVVLFYNLDEDFKVKWYLLSYSFTIGLDKVRYSHILFSKKCFKQANRPVICSNIRYGAKEGDDKKFTHTYFFTNSG